LACGEVRGGNEPVYTSVELPGLRGTLYSRPCHGPEGGDVHYLSVCRSGLLTRVCVADVAGHGEAVAAVGREMHAHLRQSVDIVDTRRVMADLDRRLDIEGLRSVTTAALLSYYHTSQWLTVSYAGHPPGWLYLLETSTWSRLEGGSPSTATVGPSDLPLGTGLAPAFSRRRVKISAGDRVLLVTDGVLEAPAPDGTEFGVAGVEAALPGDFSTLPARLLDALTTHTGHEALGHDDVTFFVGEFVDGPPGSALWHVLKNRVLRRLRTSGSDPK
jgi:sigma-B regulation protein RsbU (phosphoserine phosphatase)